MSERSGGRECDTMSAILKHWTQSFAKEGGVIDLPFNIEQFCRENDAAFEAMSKERDEAVALKEKAAAIAMALAMKYNERVDELSRYKRALEFAKEMLLLYMNDCIEEERQARLAEIERILGVDSGQKSGKE